MGRDKRGESLQILDKRKSEVIQNLNNIRAFSDEHLEIHDLASSGQRLLRDLQKAVGDYELAVGVARKYIYVPKDTKLLSTSCEALKQHLHKFIIPWLENSKRA